MGQANCCGLGRGLSFDSEYNSNTPTHIGPTPKSHRIPPTSSSPNSSASPSQLTSDQSVIRTYEHLRHIPAEVFLPPIDHSLQLSVHSLELHYPAIRQLVLDFNHIQWIPHEIGLLKNLTELSLACNEIQSLPQSLFTITTLTALNLGSNQLTQISNSIANLHHLSHLYVPSNRLTSLPSAMRRCTSLRHVNLADNKISFTQQSLQTTMQYHRVSRSDRQPSFHTHNSVPSLPPPPPTHSSVNVQYSQSVSSPFETGFPLPSSLTYLSLASCSLHSLPAILCQSLPNLIHLDLTENFLTSLPAEISCLSHLQVLYLSCNDLRECLCPCELARRQRDQDTAKKEAGRRKKDLEIVESADEDEATGVKDDTINVLFDGIQCDDEIGNAELSDERQVSRNHSISQHANTLTHTYTASSQQPHCCFPDLTNLYLDNNFFPFAEPLINAANVNGALAAAATLPTLASATVPFLSPCFLPPTIRFIRLDGNPLLLCKDGIADNRTIRDAQRERERDQRSSSGLNDESADVVDDDVGLRRPSFSRSRSRSINGHRRFTSSSERFINDAYRHPFNVSAVTSALTSLSLVRPLVRVEHRFILPDQILDNLYLGDWECAKNKSGLLSLGIQTVVTVAQFPPLYPHLFTYKVWNVQDIVSEDVHTHFAPFVSYVHDRRKAGSVLIHCRQGVSRSATFCIAYIMAFGTDSIHTHREREERERRERVLGKPLTVTVTQAQQDSSEAPSPLSASNDDDAGIYRSDDITDDNDQTNLPALAQSPRTAIPRPPPPPPPKPSSPTASSRATTSTSGSLACSYEAAYAYVLSRRPRIAPNAGFKQQLKAFEASAFKQ